MIIATQSKTITFWHRWFWEEGCTANHSGCSGCPWKSLFSWEKHPTLGVACQRLNCRRKPQRKDGEIGKGSDVGKLEGVGRDLEERTPGKSALFIQWTNKAAPPSITVAHLGHSSPTLTKGLGVVTATPTPPFQVPGSSSEMPRHQLLTHTSNMRCHNCWVIAINT